MTTTVAQLIAKLQTLPQDAIVRCQEERHVPFGSYYEWTELDLETHVDVWGDGAFVDIGE